MKSTITAGAPPIDILAIAQRLEREAEERWPPDHPDRANRGDAEVDVCRVLSIVHQIAHETRARLPAGAER